MYNDFLKRLVMRTCSPQTQRRLRRYYVVHQVLKDPGPSEAEAALLPTLIAPGDFVADLGANVGNFTKMLSALVGQSGHVYSFEPIEENYEILDTVVLKGCLPNVTHFCAAAGPQSGRCEMVIPDSADFTRFYTAHMLREGDTGQIVGADQHSLDDLWKKKVIPRLDFIKCDVEGAELGVLRGALELLRNQHPGWLMEVGRSMSGEVFGILRDLGYRGFVYDGRLVETETYRDKEFSNYFFFVPQSTLWRRIFSPSSKNS